MFFGLIEKKNYKDFDWILIVIVVLILIYGMVVLANATAKPFTGSESGFSDIVNNLDLSTIGLQALWIVVGFCGMIVMTVFDYDLYSEMSKVLYLVTVGVLLLLLVVAKATRGTQGWFSLGSRGLQPAELAKIIIIITISKVAAKKSAPEGRLKPRD